MRNITIYIAPLISMEDEKYIFGTYIQVSDLFYLSEKEVKRIGRKKVYILYLSYDDASISAEAIEEGFKALLDEVLESDDYANEPIVIVTEDYSLDRVKDCIEVAQSESLSLLSADIVQDCSS